MLESLNTKKLKVKKILEVISKTQNQQLNQSMKGRVI